VTSPVRRAGAFAAVGSLALAVPLFEGAAAAPFAAIAALAVFSLEEGPVFELFARPGERRERRLYGLIGFTLAASGIALLSALWAMPVGVGVGTILLVPYGNLAAQIVRTRVRAPVAIAGGYALGAGLACGVGQAVALQFSASSVVGNLPEIVFLAASGALLGALLRTLLFESDEPHVMLTTGLGLWLLAEIGTDVGGIEVAVAVAVTVVVGYLSYVLDTASVSGMLTGVLLGLVTIVLGGLGWFAVLITFFGVGGLSTKFRYEKKRQLGVAEGQSGARSTANVLANGAVGLVAVLAYAAVGIHWQVGQMVIPAGTIQPAVFLFAFVGSLATAMSDTLSSEIGGVYDHVRLITTLRPVDPGTDGGITWQGELAGLCGAAVIAAVAYVVFGELGLQGAVLVTAAGVVGMTVDSLLGATVEGKVVGNEGVNLLATLSGAVVAGVGALALGLL